MRVGWQDAALRYLTTKFAKTRRSRRLYSDFYRWGSIVRGAWAKDAWAERLRHVAYAGGWKKFEPLWDLAIRARRVTRMLPVLEGVLSGFGRHAATVQRCDAVANQPSTQSAHSDLTGLGKGIESA